MPEENPNKPTSVRFSPADVSDLEELVTKGIFTHFSDAARAVSGHDHSEIQ